MSLLVGQPDDSSIPKPVPSPGLIPLESPADEKLSPAEDRKRAPATHWDLVKSNIVVIGTLCAIVLGFITFGDRVVSRAESKTAEGVKATNEALKQHIEDSRILHTEIRDGVRELTGEMKEFRNDAKALYRAMPAKRRQSRLEVDVVEPDELEFKGMPTRRDGGR